MLHNANNEYDLKDTGNSGLFLLSGLVLLGFLLRLYAFINAPVINSDGILYINQSKALLEGNWELARKCGYGFISLYHLLITIVYRISGDWIFSAKSISLFFGTAAIIPFYLMMKQLFRKAVAGVASLAFVMHPFFVIRSIELIKDPIFWFFALLGMLFFTIALKKDNRSYFLVFSAISFLFAGLARIEILLYFAGTIIYISLCEDAKKKKLLLFCLPLFVLFCLLVITDLFLIGHNMYLWNSYLLPRGRHFFSIFSHNHLSADINKSAFIAFRTLISQSIPAISLQLLPFFMAGFIAVKSEIKKQKLYWYFIIIVLLSLLTICLFYLKTGIMSPRYIAIATLPGSIIICLGIERVLQFFERNGLQAKTAILFISLYIIISIFFYHSLFHNKKEKMIYRSVGEYIASVEKNRNTVVMSSDSRTMFYANLNAREAECGNQSAQYKALLNLRYQEIVSFLKNNRVNYFVWEEKIWKHEAYDFPGAVRPEDLKKIMRSDSAQGKIILFKVSN